MLDIEQLLSSDDKRSLGHIEELIHLVKTHIVNLNEVIELFFLSKNELVKMRTIDAVEKLSRENPEPLAPYKEQFIKHFISFKQKEIRWHMAQIIPRFNLSKNERIKVISLLKAHYLTDSSSIVKTFTLQALVDLATQQPTLTPEISTIIKEAIANGTPAMKARGKKLMVEIRKLKSTS